MKVCANPDCRREFEPYHGNLQRYCCAKCQIHMQRVRAVADGRADSHNAARRAKRAAIRNARCVINNPACSLSRNAIRRDMNDGWMRKVFREMELPREELMAASAKWTLKERKLAQRMYEKKHGLFRSVPERMS